jgi:hypothetical protein
MGESSDKGSASMHFIQEQLKRHLKLAFWKDAHMPFSNVLQGALRLSLAFPLLHHSHRREDLMEVVLLEKRRVIEYNFC